MAQDTIIKFRATEHEKARLHAAAERAGTTSSALLRRAVRDIAAERRIGQSTRSDIAALRRLLNEVGTTDAPTPATTAELRSVATRLLGSVG